MISTFNLTLLIAVLLALSNSAYGGTGIAQCTNDDNGLCAGNSMNLNVDCNAAYPAVCKGRCSRMVNYVGETCTVGKVALISYFCVDPNSICRGSITNQATAVGQAALTSACNFFFGLDCNNQCTAWVYSGRRGCAYGTKATTDKPTFAPSRAPTAKPTKKKR